MAINLTVNGNTYNYPELGDQGWADAATGWAEAVTQGMLQKAGGTFTLTAEVDFGAAFGLKSAYFKSRATNPASAGIVRLGNTESVSWRNAANNANLGLSLNGSDEFVFQGPVVPSANNASDLGSSSLSWKDVYADGVGYFGSLSVGTISAASFTATGGVDTANTLWLDTGSGLLKLRGSTNGVQIDAYNGSTAVGWARSTPATLTAYRLDIFGASGSSHYIAFRENIVADKFAIGCDAGSSSLKFRLTSDSGTEVGSISSAGLWTIGASGGTQTHAVNGYLNLNAANSTLAVINSGNNEAAIVEARATNASTSGGAGSFYRRLSASDANWIVGLEVGSSDAYVIRNATAFGGGTLALSIAKTSAAVSIRGTNTNNNASSGFVGEYVESIVSTATNAPGTTGQFGNMASISLGAGDWDVTGLGIVYLNGSTWTAALGNQLVAISVNSGNTTTDHVLGSNVSSFVVPTSTGERPFAVPSYRLSLASTTTVYFKLLIGYSAGNPQFVCRISARRVR